MRDVLQMKVEVDADLDEFRFDYRLKSLLVHFPDVIERSVNGREPHILTTYLTELASTFNSWYATDRIIVGEVVMKGKLDLTKALEIL